MLTDRENRSKSVPVQRNFLNEEFETVQFEWILARAPDSCESKAGKTVVGSTNAPSSLNFRMNRKAGRTCF